MGSYKGCRSGNAATNVEFSEKCGYDAGLLFGSSVSPELRDRINLK